MRELVATSFDDLQEFCSHIATNAQWAFRGESQIFADTTSSIDRKLRGISSISSLHEKLEIEIEASLRFFRSAASSVSGFEAAYLSDPIQSQILMRHYGAPTRLLDWSRSWQVAAYWACEADFECDGQVFAFIPDRLSEAMRSEHGEHTEAWRIPTSYREGFPVTRLFNHEYLDKAPDVVLPFHVNALVPFPRLVTQQGLFTFANKPQIDHWRFITTNLPGGRRARVVIPSASKGTIKAALNERGIHAAFLLPGPEGGAREALSLVHARVRDIQSRATQ